jgi:RNA polymerase sigma-70 factor, ECF subfamily
VGWKIDVRKAVQNRPFHVAMLYTSLGGGPVMEIEEIYRVHAPRLYRALLLYAGDREIATDAVAEAFAQALAHLDGIRSPERWIWKAAYRIAAGELAHRHRSTTGNVPDVGYEIPEAPLMLSLVMRQLSPMQRAAVALHDYAGYTLREVASITGSTASAVSVHLVRGHARLRKQLEDRNEG